MSAIDDLLKAKYLPLMLKYATSMHTEEAKEAFYRADCEIEAIANGTEPDYSVEKDAK